MPRGAHAHRMLKASLSRAASCVPKRTPAHPQSRKPCHQKHGFLSLSRVQGGSACRESKGQRPWPSEVLKAKRPEGVRHFVLGITCRNRSPSGERKQLRQGNKQPNKREGGDRPSPIKSSGYPVTMAARENTASITPGTTIAASTWRTRRTSPGSEPG